MWFETDRHELVLGRMLCLDASNNVEPMLGKCHELGGSQEWKHKGSVSCKEKKNNRQSQAVVHNFGGDHGPAVGQTRLIFFFLSCL